MAMNVEIWHNPRCSKSRETLALLKEHNIDVTVVLYLQAPPSRAQLEHAQRLLKRPLLAMVRSKDPLFHKLGLSENNPDAQLYDALENNPSLIERPIVLTDRAAAIGRPPEAVLTLLSVPMHRS